MPILKKYIQILILFDIKGCYILLSLKQSLIEFINYLSGIYITSKTLWN